MFYLVTFVDAWSVKSWIFRKFFPIFSKKVWLKSQLSLEMADYPGRRDGGPPLGSYPPRYDPDPRSGYPEADRRYPGSASHEAARYRDPSGGVAAPSRHSVRVDFNDFDRGGYRSPSPPVRYWQPISFFKVVWPTVKTLIENNIFKSFFLIKYTH